MRQGINTYNLENLIGSTINFFLNNKSAYSKLSDFLLSINPNPPEEILSLSIEERHNLLDDPDREILSKMVYWTLIEIMDDYIFEKELNYLSMNRFFRIFIIMSQYHRKSVSQYLHTHSFGRLDNDAIIFNLPSYLPYLSEMLEIAARRGERSFMDSMILLAPYHISEEEKVRLQIQCLINNPDEDIRWLDRAYILSDEILKNLLRKAMYNLFYYSQNSQNYRILIKVINTLLNSGANPESLCSEYKSKLYKIFPEWLDISTARNLWFSSAITESANSKVSNDDTDSDEIDELTNQTQTSTSYLQRFYLYLMQWVSSIVWNSEADLEDQQGESSSSNEIEVVITDEETKDDKGKEEEIADDKGKEEEKEEPIEDEADYTTVEEPFIHENYIQWLNYDEMQILMSFIAIAHQQSR